MAVIFTTESTNGVISTENTVRIVTGGIGIQGPPGQSGGNQRVSSFFTGNGSQTVFTLTHSLGSKYISMSFWLTNNDVTDEPVLVDWQPISTSAARVTFPGSRPLASGWRIDWLAIG